MIINISRAARPIAHQEASESASTVARAAAIEGIVLLRNDGGLLPLPAKKKLAVLGPLSERMAIQGGGSAEVTPAYISSPIQAIRQRQDP